MKNQFVMTGNVRKFESGIEHINHKLKGVERMLLVTGEPGLGKTEASIHHAAINGAVMIRTLQLMTGPWLLREVVKELGAAPERRIADVFDQIIDLQKTKPRTIIFDEVDRFAEKTEILETIRDIHDVCHCPIVFVGEEMADKKLMRYRRLYRRFVEIIRFDKLDRDGVKQFIEEISEVKFDPKALDRAASETNGKISEIITLVHKAEGHGKRRGQSIVGVEELWKS
jgi:DNA transposition AAA+ family ATPase